LSTAQNTRNVLSHSPNRHQSRSTTPLSARLQVSRRGTLCRHIMIMTVSTPTGPFTRTTQAA